MFDLKLNLQDGNDDLKSVGAVSQSLSFVLMTQL